MQLQSTRQRPTIGAALRMAVMTLFLLGQGSFLLAQFSGRDPALGTVDPYEVAHATLAGITIAATLWERARLAVAAWLLVMAGTLWRGLNGVELEMAVVVTVHTVVTRSRRRVVAVVVAAQIVSIVFAVVIHDGLSPRPWSAVAIVIAVAVASLLLRRIVAATKRYRWLSHDIAARTRWARIAELSTLADELESVIVDRLEQIRSVAAASIDTAETTRQAVGQIQRLAVSLQSELQTLLGVLRKPAQPPMTSGAATMKSTSRVVVRVLFAVSVAGMAATAVLVWTGAEPHPWMLVLVGLMCLLGAVCGRDHLTVAVTISAVHIVVTLLVRTELALLYHAVAVGYVFSLTSIATVATVRIIDERAAAGAALARVKSEERLGTARERRAVARDIHDVVGYQLSSMSMRLMAVEAEDLQEVREALVEIDGQAVTAKADLQALLKVLRSTEPTVDRVGPLVRPTATVASMAESLCREGFDPTVEVASVIDELSESQQRTLVRVFQEATSNILRYGRPGPCSFTATPTGDEDIFVVVRNERADDAMSSLSHGLGLQGLKERVELLGGDFRAGPQGPQWVLTVRLRSAHARLRLAG